MASISSYETKAGRRWRVRYRTPEGRSTDRRGFLRKRDAEAFSSELEVSKRQGLYVAPSAGRITLAEIGREWLAGRAHLKESTRVRSEQNFRVHIVPKWGDWPVGAIQTGQVRAWVAQLVAGKVGAAVIRQSLGDLSQILDYAVEARRISQNPAKGVPAPKLSSAPRGYLEHDQVAALADEIGTGHHFDLLVRFLAYTGLRIGEAAGLRVESVNFQRRRIEVRESLTEVEGRLVRGQTKTYERRSVPFPAFLSEPLRLLVADRAGDDPLFRSPEGHPLRRTVWHRRYFKPAVERCQQADRTFPHVTPHDLRHTAASLAISAGANVKAVQRMLGHSKAAITLDTYADLFPDDLDAVAESLDRAAAGARPLEDEVAALDSAVEEVTRRAAHLLEHHGAKQLAQAGLDIQALGAALEAVRHAINPEAGEPAA